LISSTDSLGSTIAVVGIVKNIEKNIKQDVRRIESALSRFENIKWFLVESNSTDDSQKVLRKLSETYENFHFITISSGSIQESRILGMADGRNRYLQELRENQTFFDCEYVAVADFNGLNDLLNQNAIDSCFVRQNWDVCCANQNGPYYDIWALRHPLWSPNDCWQEHEFLRQYIKYPERALYAAVQSRMIKIPKNSDWLEVDSAFGGFAIYKREMMLKSSYSAFDNHGNIICEHVPFHNALRNLGAHIFINPAMINTKFTDHNSAIKLKNKMLRQLMYPLKYFWKINAH
jgi:glycosyltransferase involved in cell wall biosynthesis